MIDGKLCRKLIHSELPYWIILKIIHHDDSEFKLDLEFIDRLADTNKRSYKAWLALTKPTIKQRLGNSYKAWLALTKPTIKQRLGNILPRNT